MHPLLESTFVCYHVLFPCLLRSDKYQWIWSRDVTRFQYWQLEENEYVEVMRLSLVAEADAS